MIGRLHFIKKRLNELNVEGIVILSMDNIRYLSRFTGSDGALLVTINNQYLLVDNRYTTQAKIETKGFTIKSYKDKFNGIANLINRLNLLKVGLESQNITLSSYYKFKKLIKNIELLPLEDEVENLRTVKDKEEINIIMEAIDIAERSFMETQNKIDVLKTEKEISDELEYRIKKNGGDGLAFDIIVASGIRSALPHGRSSRKRLEKGDFIIIDFGVNKDGYNSDETVTLIVGEPSQRHKDIYSVVKEAHDEGISRIKPGIRFSDIDRCVRKRIRDKGYGKYFGHGTGHGIGLSVHEKPYIIGRNRDTIEEGMIFTIEPGVYIPGFGGVRIEDMVLATETGCKVLTSLPKELISI
jgi:Xaa-Pro aminopeptidase